MPTWFVQTDDKIKSFDEERLRKKLRHGDLSGAELARQEGDTEWRPLYEVPLFREEVPTGDPRATARSRVAVGFGSHLFVFLAVVLGLWATSGNFPGWSMFWAIGLFFHGRNAYASIRSLDRRPALATETGSNLPVAQTASETSPFMAELDGAIHNIHELRRDTPVPGLDEVRAAALELDQGHARLRELASPGTRAALETERAELESSIASADPRTAEAYASTLEALRQRLATMREAEAAAARLDARRRTLLHQLEGLRLSLVHARLDTHETPDLGERVRELRRSADARAEVDEALARARRAMAQRS